MEENVQSVFCLNGRFVATQFNLDLTIIDRMERLPTEIMLEVFGHLDEPTIRSLAITSSKYCAIAQPLIFRQICVSQMDYKRFTLFVEQMQKNSKLALMIKVLIIWRTFTIVSLPHLLAVVSNLEELLIRFKVDTPFLTPHYFPNLRRLRFGASMKIIIDDLVANFIPRHEYLNDLEIEFTPSRSTNDSGNPHLLTLAESASSWVNRLVRYHGPCSLLPLLTPNSKMKFLASSDQLGEMTLRELSHAMSGGLLALIVDIPMDWSLTLSISLLPSLFPNLRYIAWLSIHSIHPHVYDHVVGRAHVFCAR
jgi:hypothetical protein